MSAILKLELYFVLSVGLEFILLIFLKKKGLKEITWKYIFVASSILTIFIHYSDFLHDLIFEGKLNLVDNLLFSVYPCNLIMWLCLILCFLDSDKKLFKICAEFVGIAGTVCGLVGICANPNFLGNPSFKDYSILKGLISHNAMVFSTLTLLFSGKVKLSSLRNLISCIFGLGLMIACAIYTRLVDIYYGVTGDAQMRSMYLFDRPFEDKPLLTFPFIVAVALVAFFIILNVIEFIVKDKEDRWYKQKHLGIKY